MAGKKHSVSDLFPYLKGRWSFERQIFSEGNESQMIGEGSFTSSAKGLTYHESGILRQGEYQGFFEQKFFLVFSKSQKAQAEVYRQQKAFFFLLDLSRGFQKIEHQCGDDFYQGSLCSFEKSLECHWDISGPRKKYTLVSHFIKVEEE